MRKRNNFILYDVIAPAQMDGLSVSVPCKQAHYLSKVFTWKAKSDGFAKPAYIGI